MKIAKLFTGLIIGALLMSEAQAAETILLDTKDGQIVIELLTEKAPNHAARIKQLTEEGFYDGIVFHRVIDGFMAQTGDPTGTGSGGSKLGDLKAEFNDESHKRGVVSMARSGDPDSANSQFFIVLEDSPFLDRQYTAFGKVVSGMEFVDKIKKGDKTRNGSVRNPDKIVKMSVKSESVAKSDAEIAPATPAKAAK